MLECKKLSKSQPNHDGCRFWQLFRFQHGYISDMEIGEWREKKQKMMLWWQCQDQSKLRQECNTSVTQLSWHLSGGRSHVNMYVCICKYQYWNVGTMIHYIPTDTCTKWSFGVQCKLDCDRHKYLVAPVSISMQIGQNWGKKKREKTKSGYVM